MALMAVVLSVSMCCTAQIQKTIMGFTLGTSTREYVKQTLTRKGYKLKNEVDGSFSIENKDVYYAGIAWNYINFIFYENKLESVWLQNNEQRSSLPLEDLYSKLYDTLTGKYGQYIFKNEDGNVLFTDNTIFLSLNKGYYKGTQYVSISYEDMELMNKKQKQEESEL